MIPIRDLIDNAVAAAVEGQADDAAEAIITAGELIDELATAITRIENLIDEARSIARRRGDAAIEKKLFEALMVAQAALAKVGQADPAPPAALANEVIAEIDRQFENAQKIFRLAASEIFNHDGR